MKKILTILFSVCFILSVNAQIYSTNFGTTTTGTPASPFNPTPLVKDPNVTTTGWTGGTQFEIGTSGGAYAIGSGGRGTYTITLVIATGYTLEISAINFQMRATTNAATTVAVNVGGIVFTGTTLVENAPYKAITSSGTAPLLTGNVTIRITTTGGNGSSPSSINSLDDVVISGTNVLPAKLQSFTALNKASAVNFKWNVGFEFGILNYDIERSSNGANFIKISTVSAQNSANYNATDNSPKNGLNYYRLKINEINGTFNYSDIVKVKVTGKSLTINSLYPNPATNFIKVGISSSSAATGSIAIMDILGSTVLTDNASLIQGLKEKNINVSNLKPGVYILKVSVNGETAYEKFVKQ